MECVRCRRELPADAMFFPWCGKRQPETAPPLQRKHRRRPKGSGSVYKLGGKRAHPYLALTPEREVLGTYETAGEAVKALDAYISQNVPVSRLKYTFSDVYAKWSETHYQDVGEKGRDSYERAYQKAEVLWDRPIRELVTADYQVVIDALVSAGLSRSMYEKQRQLCGRRKDRCRTGAHDPDSGPYQDDPRRLDARQRGQRTASPAQAKGKKAERQRGRESVQKAHAALRH